jgi:hypothetical protein
VRPRVVTAGTSAGGGIDGVDVVELALHAPEAVEVIAHGAQAAGHVADATGRAALGAARVATETSDGAGEASLEVLASLFDGL